MNFGERLKNLRMNADLTQPQLSEKAGIEQSYLSKLENDRSVPSGAILNQLFKALDIDLDSFMDDLSPHSQRKLQQIPEVSLYLKQNQISVIKNRKQWLVVSATLCVIGSGLFSSAHYNAFFPETIHQYTSEGIVLEGESNEVFNNWKELARTYSDSKTEPEKPSAMQRKQKEREMYDRKNEVYLLSPIFKGRIYNVPVKGGSRTFYWKNSRNVPRWQNKVLFVLGVMFFVAGLFGLLIERKK